VPWTTDTKHRNNVKFSHAKFDGNIGQYNEYISNYVIYVQIILIKKPGRNGVFAGVV
jgi:hypothetical protein